MDTVGILIADKSSNQLVKTYQIGKLSFDQIAIKIGFLWEIGDTFHMGNW